MPCRVSSNNDYLYTSNFCYFCRILKFHRRWIQNRQKEKYEGSCHRRLRKQIDRYTKKKTQITETTSKRGKAKVRTSKPERRTRGKNQVRLGCVQVAFTHYDTCSWKRTTSSDDVVYKIQSRLLAACLLSLWLPAERKSAFSVRFVSGSDLDRSPPPIN